MKLQSSIRWTLSAALLLLPTIVVTAGQAKTSETECSLVCNIARDGMLEVRLGKIAETRATSESVKKFARHMVMDHSKANEELKEAAKKDAVELPANISAEQKEKEESFKTCSAAVFDSKYMAAMVAGHKKACEAVEKESTTGSGNLKAWAEKTLPVIKEHNKEANAIESKLAHVGTEN